MKANKSAIYKCIVAVVVIIIAGVSALAGYVWCERQKVQSSAAQLSTQQGSKFTYEYVPPRDAKLKPTYELVRSLDVFKKLPEIRAVDGAFVLPNQLHFVAAECQETNAFYLLNNELVLCYELVSSILKRGRQIARTENSGKDFPEKYLIGALRFIMLHELGHALIHELNLPITGREETAADELAAVIMLLYLDHSETRGTVENSIVYAGNFLSPKNQQLDNTDFADTHEIGEQRYFNLLCMIFGSDPAHFLSIVTENGLPVDRAATCPANTQRMMSSWYTLLNPHLASKYQKSFDAWYKRLDEGRTEQNKHIPKYIR